MSQDRPGWSEEDSTLYEQLAVVAVPCREEQLATLITQIPFGVDESFRIVELACGGGSLARALMELYPRATLLAMDGSSSMLRAARQRLVGFGSRAEVASFDLAADDWYVRIEGAGCVISTLAVHHLPDEGKRRLFRSVFDRLHQTGALLIADVIAGFRPQTWGLHADLYDRIAKAQSLSSTGSRNLVEQLEREEWNLFRHPDPVDMPATIGEQLAWLGEAGFRDVDCWWLRAGHAVFGGYKTAWVGKSHGVPINGPSYDHALTAVFDALAN